MKPGFALDLDEDGISLLRRNSADDGWLRVGEVSLDDPELSKRLKALREKAAKFSNGPFATKLILPESQLLYARVETEGDPFEDIERELAARTPYSIDQLVYDTCGGVPFFRVVAVAKETLKEAETFLAPYDFQAVGFTARPSDDLFDREPNLGTTGLGARLGFETDDAIVRIVSKKTSKPSKPPEKAETSAPLAEPDPIVELDPVVEPTTISKEISEATKAAPDFTPEPAPESAPEHAQTVSSDVAEILAEPAPETPTAPEREEGLANTKAAGSVAKLTAPPPFPETAPPGELIPNQMPAPSKVAKKKPSFEPRPAKSKPKPKAKEAQPVGDTKADAKENFPTAAFSSRRRDAQLTTPMIGTTPELPEATEAKPKEARQEPPLEAPKKAASKDATPKEAAPKETAPRDAPPKEAAPKPAAAKEAAPQKPVEPTTSEEAGKVEALGSKLKKIIKKKPRNRKAKERAKEKQEPVIETAPSSDKAGETAAPPKPAEPPAVEAPVAKADAKLSQSIEADEVPAKPDPKIAASLTNSGKVARPEAAGPEPKAPNAVGKALRKAENANTDMRAPARSKTKVPEKLASRLKSAQPVAGDRRFSHQPPRATAPRIERPKAAGPIPKPPALADAKNPADPPVSKKARDPLAEAAARNSGPAGRWKLGAILTLLLVLALGLFAVFSSYLLPENAVANLFGRQPVESVSTETQLETELDPLPAPLEETELDLAALPPSTDPLPDLTAPDPVRLDENEIATLPEEEDTIGTLPELETEPEPDPVLLQPLTGLEAETAYAVSGIWQKAPDVGSSVDANSLEGLYVASLDPNLSFEDAPALALPPTLEGELPFAEQPSPPPPGILFSLDERGLVRPSPEGTENPEGVLIFAGRPPIVASPRPTGVIPDPEVERREALAAFRPAPRPERLLETRERAQFGGLSRSELAAFRPAQRPASAQDQAAAIARAIAEAESETTEEVVETVSRLAVAASLQPAPRPRAIEVAAAARARQQPATAAPSTSNPAPDASTASVAAPRRSSGPAVARASRAKPNAPTRASVARAATDNNAIALGRLSLVGVFGTSSSRQALVRMPNGRFKKVTVGDRVDGGRVAAIDGNSLRLNKGGRVVVLKMPQG